MVNSLCLTFSLKSSSFYDISQGHLEAVIMGYSSTHLTHSSELLDGGWILLLHLSDPLCYQPCLGTITKLGFPSTPNIDGIARVKNEHVRMIKCISAQPSLTTAKGSSDTKKREKQQRWWLAIIYKRENRKNTIPTKITTADGIKWLQ